MPKPKKQYQPITLVDWQAFAQEEEVRRRITEDVILHFHPPLVEHFSGVQQVTWPVAVAALHCVLSWMQNPQILTKKLKPVASFDPTKQQRVVTLLQQARDGGEVLTEQELKELMPFTTNSSIGLSKLLHFFAPATYPIWDTFVANQFFTPKPDYGYLRSAAAFKEYRQVLADWASQPDAQAITADIRQLRPQLAGVTTIRLFELVLWHKGKLQGR